MEILAAIAVMPACVGLALLFQIATLRIILWALQPRNENEPARREVRDLEQISEPEVVPSYAGNPAGADSGTSSQENTSSLVS
jgi:hypothetical protein